MFIIKQNRNDLFFVSHGERAPVFSSSALDAKAFSSMADAHDMISVLPKDPVDNPSYKTYSVLVRPVVKMKETPDVEEPIKPETPNVPFPPKNSEPKWGG